jgi:hypothetical protein
MTDLIMADLIISAENAAIPKSIAIDYLNDDLRDPEERTATPGFLMPCPACGGYPPPCPRRALHRICIFPAANRELE